MDTLIIHRIASTAVMPLVAASGWAGYSHYQPAPIVPVCTILAGDTGPQYAEQNDVYLLQRFLIARGYMRGTATGYFGHETLIALERFQADIGLPVTGVADAQTRAYIQQWSCSQAALQTPVNPSQPYYPPQQGSTITMQGVDAPSSLVVGQSGSWSVRILSRQNAGQLNYAVTWGDENNAARSSASTYYPAAPVQSSGTFTHAYARAGTYTATFTVTDGYGNRTQAKVTTQVTAPYPYQNASNPYTGNGYGSGYGYGTENGYGNSTGCTTYYDRNCYVNNQYVGPSFGGGYTYNGPGDSCYYSNGQWQGSNCGGTSWGNSYPITYSAFQQGGTYNDSRCYYDRACLARMNGTSY